MIIYVYLDEKIKSEVTNNFINQILTIECKSCLNKGLPDDVMHLDRLNLYLWEADIPDPSYQGGAAEEELGRHLLRDGHGPRDEVNLPFDKLVI